MTKILLVEDDKSLREIYGVRLLAEGYDIVSAGDGEEALAMAIKEKPTLIISDVMMPKISGFDMLDILRSTTETRDIKVIMMTALSSDDQRSRGEQLGADKYLVKSQVGIEDVVRTVHEVLGDVPGITSTPAAAAVAAAVVTPAAPVADAAATPAPVETTATPEPTTPVEDNAAPADDAATPQVVAPTEDTSSPAAAPGNEEAGPLPPQPTETSLPQPTAPFSSPRPATLGEQVIQPLDSAPAPDPLSAETIAQELQAAAEPVNTQVDESVSESAPATDFAPASDTPSTDFSTPVADTPADNTFSVPEAQPADSVVPTVMPTDLDTTVSPAQDQNNDQPTTPAV